jgi:excisionase family DNA binding protein
MTISAAPPDPAAFQVLLDVQQVADLLNCSARHVYRLADAGRMPAPLKLGALVRWRRQDLDTWLTGGCRPVRAAGKGGQPTTRGEG